MCCCGQKGSDHTTVWWRSSDVLQDLKQVTIGRRSPCLLPHECGGLEGEGDVDMRRCVLTTDTSSV